MTEPHLKARLCPAAIKREPMTGVIRQDNRVVGTICFTGRRSQEFIDDFYNNCYGPLRLHIELLKLPHLPR